MQIARQAYFRDMSDELRGERGFVFGRLTSNCTTTKLKGRNSQSTQQGNRGGTYRTQKAQRGRALSHFFLRALQAAQTWAAIPTAAASLGSCNDIGDIGAWFLVPEMRTWTLERLLKVSCSTAPPPQRGRVVVVGWEVWRVGASGGRPALKISSADAKGGRSCAGTFGYLIPGLSRNLSQY